MSESPAPLLVFPILFNSTDVCSSYETVYAGSFLGDGVDLILEMLANVNLNNDLQILKTSVGRVVVIGNRGTIDINPRFLMTKETRILGITLIGSTDVR